MSEAVAIMLLTWGGLPERREYARRTLDALIANIRCAGPIFLHVADDGSPDDHRADLISRAEASGRFAGVTSTDSQGLGYGVNYNDATHVVHDLAEFILPIEDDWELTRDLDLDPLIEALADPRIGCIRLGYLGFTEGFRGETIHAAGHTYLLLAPDSPDPHVFSGHPRIETRTWERHVGLWPEGLNPGATEWEVAHRPEAREDVAWPLDLVLAYGSLFGHVGTVQARKDQQ